jgi:2-methylisocitrate lyase-like PEP mutase family enzyme
MTVDRARFRAEVMAPGTTYAPVTITPLAARQAAQLGFRAGYLSGGALGFTLAVSEALLTLTELVAAASAITSRSDLPLVADGGVGFGDPVHLSRAVQELEKAGACAIEIEDQIAPKRVSHHRGIEHLVPPELMVQRVEAATTARRDDDFLVIARTNAVASEGFAAAIERGRRYADAGADMILIFPGTDEEWREAPTALDHPTVAIDIFGARPAGFWEAAGYALVMDAVTGQAVAFEATRQAHLDFLDGSAAPDLESLSESFRAIGETAGLEPFYDIEERTTEAGSTTNSRTQWSTP